MMDPDRTGVTHEPHALLLWNDDPRLRNLLAPELLPEKTGSQELGELLPDPIKHEYLKSCVVALYDELARQEAQTLEEAAEDIVSQADLIFHEEEQAGRYRSAPCGNNVVEALLLRYGLVGQPPATLDVMGQAIGRTRERARQIQDKHGQALHSTRPSWPQLDRALELARLMAPCREEDLAEELIRHKLTAIRYSLKSLQACADFGRRDFELEEADGVVCISSPELASLIHAIKALSSRQGLASLLQISDELLDDGIVMSENDVRTNLLLTDGAAWLDDTHVTWLGAPRNRLINTLRTMLSVHQPVALEAARQAITDFWTYRNAGRTADQRDLIPPTSDGLRAFCSWHPDFAVVAAGGGDCIRSTIDLDFASELGVEAAMLVELIRSAPDTATDRVTLLEAAEAVGMKSATVSIYLSFHPAFINPARNVWSILGTQLKPEAVRNIQRLALQRSRSEARDFVAGMTAQDHPWVALAVTSNLRMCGAVLRRWLPIDAKSLRLPAIDGLGDACGTVVYNAESGFTHGLATYFRRFDVRVGEFLLLTADLDWETAQITHGGSHLLRGPMRDAARQKGPAKAWQ
jgi:uncharacterized protein YjiS (DUF1127 family)